MIFLYKYCIISSLVLFRLPIILETAKSIANECILVMNTISTFAYVSWIISTYRFKMLSVVWYLWIISLILEITDKEYVTGWKIYLTIFGNEINLLHLIPIFLRDAFFIGEEIDKLWAIFLGLLPLLVNTFLLPFCIYFQWHCFIINAAIRLRKSFIFCNKNCNNFNDLCLYIFFGKVLL